MKSHSPCRWHGRRLTALLALTLVAGSPGIALADQMLTLTDPDTECNYFVRGDNLSPRLRRDGLPDCPDVGRVSATDREIVRELSQLRDEVKSLRREAESMRREAETIRRELERKR